MIGGVILILNCLIREIKQEEIENALSLVWKVFQEYEACDYSKEGVEEFYNSIYDINFISRLCLYGAFLNNELVGVIATRNEGTHIALFFVDGKYQKQGIGKQLFQTIKMKNKCNKMTVNSSPYALPVYYKLGFKDTDSEQVVNGIRFTPMELIMNITLFIDDLNEYLKEDSVIDYKNEIINKLADTLYQESVNEIEYIRKVYEFVRDNISHSADINEDVITCSASEVLAAKHGICFAKSHLLAALLRCKSIPTGFCYQKLILDDETTPVLIYHGLNGVYVSEYKKWIRLDARGNKEGVNAQFSLDEEYLAFPIRTEKGEEDGLIIYPNPNKNVLEQMKKYKTRTELWIDLPNKLE